MDSELRKGDFVYGTSQKIVEKMIYVYNETIWPQYNKIFKNKSFAFVTEDPKNNYGYYALKELSLYLGQLSAELQGKIIELFIL